MTTHTLFVGGPHDGLRMAVPDLPVIELFDPSAGWDVKTGDRHLYYRDRLAVDDRTWIFYRHSGLTTADACGALLAGYHDR